HVLTADPVTAATPLILVSGRTTSDDVVTGIEAGAHDYITKPFRTVEFIVRCRAALRTARAYRRVADSAAELRLLADHASDLILRCGVDGRVRYVSPSVEALLGWRPDEVAGRPAADFCHP